jgi:hypothetical protein
VCLKYWQYCSIQIARKHVQSSWRIRPWRGWGGVKQLQRILSLIHLRTIQPYENVNTVTKKPVEEEWHNYRSLLKFNFNLSPEDNDCIFIMNELICIWTIEFEFEWIAELILVQSKSMWPILILTMVISVGSKKQKWPTVTGLIISVLASTYKWLHNYIPPVTRSIILQNIAVLYLS